MKELFTPPYSDKIKKNLPVLFNLVELENRRGQKLGMEVGTARERVLIALFMYIFENDAVEFPPSTSHEVDVYVKKVPISIKTKTGTGSAGIKLKWTTDWIKVKEFVANYKPSSNLLVVQIKWGAKGKFCWISLELQQEIFALLGREKYLKEPKQGSNPRGVEISGEAFKLLLSKATCLEIDWQRDLTMIKEKALYQRWIELWDSL